MTPAVLAGIPYRTLVSFDVGPLTIRTFGILVALGVVAGAVVATRYVSDRGIPSEDFTQLATRAVIAGFIGARLSWVVSHWDEIDGPVDVIAVWDGGLQFTGGFVLAVAVGIWQARGRFDPRRRWAILDGSALGLTLGLAIGRLGCTVVGEHLGGPTDFFLGMEYRGGETVEGPLEVGVTYHQTAVYEFLHLMILFGIMQLLLRRANDTRRPLTPGLLSGMFLAWYVVARFATDFLRIYDRTVLGLTGAQWALLAVLPLGIWTLATLPRRRALVEQTAADAPDRDQQTSVTT